MAQFTVTIIDAAVPRIQQAFGHFDNSNPPVWVLATLADVQAFVKNQIHAVVTEYETRLQAQAKRDAVSAEVW